MPIRSPFLIASVCLAARLLHALPVANPDGPFSVPEDGSLTLSGSQIFSATFDPIPWAGPWALLTGLTNGNQGTPTLGYPQDGASRAWTHPAFDTATSAPGGAWVTATMPMVGPLTTSISYYSAAGLTPVLTGSSETSGAATVSTYLLRNSFTLSAAQAAAANWSVNYLADDGIVVHLNGARAFAFNMPTGSITTTTFASTSGVETNLTAATVNLAGFLNPGVNTIAIELHQAASLSDAGLYLDMRPANSQAEGFVYRDDPFGTNSPNESYGTNLATDGRNSGGLHVRAGPFAGTNRAMSGGWGRNFTLTGPDTVTIRFDYRLLSQNGFEAGEYQLAVLEVNGSRYGANFPALSAQVPAVTALARFRGDGNGGAQPDTGWVTFSTNLVLAAGTHFLEVGAFINASSVADEWADAYFDNFEISAATGGSLLANDTGVPPLTAIKAADPAHGAVTVFSNGSFTYVPAANYFGPDSFTYRAIDSSGTSTPATVTLSVTPANDAPEAFPDAYPMTEDITLNVAAPGVLGNDTDPDGDSLTATLRAPPAGGTLVFNANGSFSYTPAPNANGVVTFTYRATDGQLNSADQTVTLNIAPVDDPPLAVADQYVVASNTTLSVTFPSTSGQTPTPETLVRQGLNVAIGSPDEVLLPVWKYRDDGSDQGTAWRQPAFDDSAWSSGLAELGYGDAADGRPERTLINGGPASARYATSYFRTAFQLLDPARLANLKLWLLRDDAAVVYLNGQEIYRDQSANGFPNLPANPAYNAYSTGSISAADETALRDLSAYLTPNATQLLTNGANVVAVEVHQAAATSSDVSFDLEILADRYAPAGVLANDSDPEGAALTASVITLPSFGALSLQANGTFTYTPNAGFTGSDSFTYRAFDGALAATGTVSLTVTGGVNRAPTATADAYSTPEDVPLVIAAPGVLGNDSDPDGDPLTAALISGPGQGTLQLAANGSFTYTPALHYNGPDSFRYRARDNRGAQSATVTVTLTVTPVNDPPVAQNDLYGAEPGLTLVVNAAQGVLANDSDVEGSPLTAMLASAVTVGNLSLAPDGSFSYTPPAGYSGTAFFTYRASDGSATSTVARVDLRVDNRPLAGADAYSVWEDHPLVVAAPGVLANDNDPEGATLAAVQLTAPTHGTLAFAANGSFTYTPAPDYAGPDSFTYAANDGILNSHPALVSLQVVARNDAPVARPDLYALQPGGMLVRSAAQGVLANDTDAETTALVVILAQAPANGGLVLQPDGSFTYTPFPAFTGVDSFHYRAFDGELESAAVEVQVRVETPGRDLVINEIFFRAGGIPEPLNREFFELYNRGPVPVDLTGWTVGSGVNFAFPPGTVVAPNGFLVVAADIAAFQAANPGVTNVVGGWTGTLSNNGENIGLVDALGQSRDEARYGNEGDWAQRARETTFGGWAWSSLADGGGRSLELRNPWLSNKQGQNWAVSNAVGGTPGRANDALSGDVPPLIKSVRHAPAVPTPTQSVTLSCELEDERPPEALTATLYWRDATTTAPGAFTAVPMSREPSGRWSATLPPRANLSIVEFYLGASDGAQIRTWPAPTPEGQNANCQYLVSSEVPSTTAETVWLVLTAAENAAYNATANNSDRQFNQTLIVTRGAESEVVYQSDMRIRGNSSRTYTFRPLRVSLPSGQDFSGMTAFNLNPKAPFLQHLGMRIFQAAGLRAPHSIPVRVRRNGLDYTTSTGSTPDYGMWVLMEDIGSGFVDEHWPLNNTGNVYKKGRNDWFWRSTQPAPANPDSLLDGWSKQNNSSRNDWSDLRNFFAVWQAAAAPYFPGTTAGDVAASGGSTLQTVGAWNNGVFTTAQMDSLATVSDFAQWARWFAVMTILQDNETNISNGQDDDYAVYFAPFVTGAVTQLRMELLPHDLDTIFGLGDSTLAFNNRGLYDMTDNGFLFRTLLPLFGTGTTPGNAVFRAQYHTELRRLLGSTLDASTAATASPPFHQLVDHHLAGWAPVATRTAIKTFATQRQTYLLGLLGSTALPPTTATSNPTWTSPAGSLVLHEILANNTAAHNNAGGFPDVVELRNLGATTRDLSGVRLTDDPAQPDKFTFAPGATLGPGEILVVYADSLFTAPGIHLGFGLDASGDALYLRESAAAGGALLDSVVFGLQPADLSIGRTGATLETWALGPPSIGAANTASALAPSSTLRINEWLGNADYRASDDFIELVNTNALPVALGGMGLTDDPINRPFRALLPPLSFMGPGAFVAFEGKGSSATPGNAQHLPFNLDSRVGSVVLFGANGAQVDRGDTLSHFRDASVGRLPDGAGAWARLPMPSPGFSNAPLADAANDLLLYLRITEMMYHPTSSTRSEYVELRNISDRTGSPVTLDVSGVRFTRGITYTFPPGTLLAPGAFLVIASDTAKFASQFPSVPLLGVYAGALDNGGERIRLELPAQSVSILDFTYDDDWHPSTDGLGDALHIVDMTGSIALWNNAGGWQAGTPNPGADIPFGVEAGPDAPWTVGTPLVLAGQVYPGSHSPDSISALWTSDAGPAAPLFTTPNARTANATFSLPGLYALRLTATAPGPVSSFDTRTITVHDTYESWAARTLAGSPPNTRGRVDDADRDGLDNLAEFVLGSDPANAASRPRIEGFLDAGIYKVRWYRNRFADTAIVAVPQIRSRLDTGAWSESPADVQYWQNASGPLLEEYEAADQSAAGPDLPRYFRLRITAP